MALLTLTTFVSLAVTAVYAIASVAAGSRLGKRLPPVEKWILAWLVFDALIHFTLEGSFVYLSLTGTVANSTHLTAALWKEYGKADSRWLHSDPTIVSLEILTVFVDGALCLLLIHAITARKFYRHYVQLVLCVCELYGGWMTFCPEWLTGSKALVTDNALYKWVYLFFFNMIWVVVPVVLMYHTWAELREYGLSPEYRRGRKRDSSHHRDASRGSGYNLGGSSSRYNLRSQKDK
ncbi:emopamil-binding protein-like [Littorina saxatilis]|uniref:EXPERA domain-containing protein n=1 Tax=Littorina saxatilis TaxID=31220 RepID=A0AAN9APT3_9CAEN